jgi:hypothetical protein
VDSNGAFHKLLQFLLWKNISFKSKKEVKPPISENGSLYSNFEKPKMAANQANKSERAQEYVRYFNASLAEGTNALVFCKPISSITPFFQLW